MIPAPITKTERIPVTEASNVNPIQLAVCVATEAAIKSAVPITRTGTSHSARDLNVIRRRKTTTRKVAPRRAKFAPANTPLRSATKPSGPVTLASRFAGMFLTASSLNFSIRSDVKTTLEHSLLSSFRQGPDSVYLSIGTVTTAAMPSSEN